MKNYLTQTIIALVAFHTVFVLLVTGALRDLKAWFKEPIIIRGCEARGDAHSAYLSRWKIFQRNWGALYFHKFHRSDADDLHDHPWNFISVILWRGYHEVVMDPDKPNVNGAYLCKRVYPGTIIYRKATHTHRVVLLGYKPAYTLVFRFKYVRFWGFYVRGNWQIFREYFKENGC
ncbi:hypothetical protein [Mucilaginibacter sp.]|uniref:hypothetical protein n=1 Tax=Mucilaginibacter sp. TaxID=1882438 RepID=UPI002613C7CB|nr:hypothetical protein [Mucilaginibacter sp.]MDB4919826.1 hypothetical protein [Mucilaginibacter sp.]